MCISVMRSHIYLVRKPKVFQIIHLPPPYKPHALALGAAPLLHDCPNCPIIDSPQVKRVGRYLKYQFLIHMYKGYVREHLKSTYASEGWS